MKIWLSRPNEKTGRRQIVLDMDRDEERMSRDTLLSHVIGGDGRAPDRRVRRDGTVRYRFPRRYTDRLLATFPFAELSPGMRRRQLRAVQAELGDVPDLVIPEFKGELYDFQKISVARMIDALREVGGVFYFNNDDLGLGKTVQAIATMAALHLERTLVVVCPNNAKWVWERMIQRFTAWDDTCVLDSTTMDRHARSEAIRALHDITIVNIEALRTHPELAEHTYDLLISDEFHRFQNPESQQTKAWHALSFDRHLLLSGTPILNRPEESWSGLHSVMPDQYPDADAFTSWLCIKSEPSTVIEFVKVPGGNGKRFKRVKHKVPGGKVVGYKPDRFSELRTVVQNPAHSIRRRREHVLDDLPEVVTSTLLVDLTREQRKLYNRIKNEKKLALADGRIKSIVGMLAYVTRAKQACFSPELYDGSPHSAKIEELRALVKQLTEAGHKALIGSQWRRAARIIERELKQYNPAYVDSSVKGPARMEQIDRFNEDEECLLYVGTIQANQEAITLDAADYVIFTDKLWSPLANDQFIGRSAAGGLRGVGVKGHVSVVELHAHDTIEERVEEVLAEKRAYFSALVERDGGPLQNRITVRDLAKLF